MRASHVVLLAVVLIGAYVLLSGGLDPAGVQTIEVDGLRPSLPESRPPAAPPASSPDTHNQPPAPIERGKVVPMGRTRR
jgi:hypothetical protein